MYCMVEWVVGPATMIPKQLILKNFLSYREARLDFQGLHIACICGPNGAGKSSLLEAIAWAVWGQSRVVSDDDIVHAGEVEAQVDFTFEHNRQLYRVLRRRRRNQGGGLEFQIKTEAGFRPLTQQGMRSTQQLICEHLRIDYETFVNSAYLRQGRADEFMLKRPAERKQILADLLKLNRYDRLAAASKDRHRQAKAEVSVLQQRAAALATQLEGYSATAHTLRELQDSLKTLNQQRQDDLTQLEQQRQQAQQRQAYLQQQALLHQQRQHLEQSLKRLQIDREELTNQLKQLQETLDQASDIGAGLDRLGRLQTREAQFAQELQQFQQLQQQRALLEESCQRAAYDLEQERHQVRQRQQFLTAQIEEEIEPILAKSAEVEAALAQLQAAKAQLKTLDQLQLQAAPLLQRHQELTSQLDLAQTRLQAKLDYLQSSQQHLQEQQAHRPQLLQVAEKITASLEYLEQRRSYQAQVREKGIERRSFMEQLQANQRTYEAQLSQINQKIRLLSEPNAACPLCDRPLDERHWKLVLERYQEQQSEIQDQIWVIREQLAASEREIQVLRQEYRELESELAVYGTMQQQRGQLEAQVSSDSDLQNRLIQLETEKEQLEQCLRNQDYGSELLEELRQIEKALSDLAYDDRNHALARGQVDRLRWAEIRHSEILQARRRRERLLQQLPELEQRLDALTARQSALQTSSECQQLAALNVQLQALNYSLEEHQALRKQISQAQSWELRQRELERAQQQQPQIQRQFSETTELFKQLQADYSKLQAKLEQLDEHLTDLPDVSDEIAQLETNLEQRQQQRDRALADLGALQQQLEHLQNLQQEQEEWQGKLSQAQHRIRVYGELAQAFGHNGIQALMVENLLPQLEAETNHLLARLSNNQLHVQFVTQRASRRQQKLIDTLDILIADTGGTRPYETYSGGEAFRVNFAIRLALARLLAQRSGMPLQMLIIDEGFSTQDKEGCERLIAAINAIAADFACILTITHVPHFREAFQTRIDVIKTDAGSRLSLSA